MNTTTIFLTGGGSFIGRNILEKLSTKYKIFAPSHKELDLLDSNSVDSFFKGHRMDVVIHAAYIGGSKKPYVPDAVEKNLRMFFNIVRNYIHFKKMIHLGSGAEYDKSRPLVKIKEENFGDRIPIDQYGFSKYLCSLYASNLKKVVVLRLFAIFGKYEDMDTRFISHAIYCALFNLPITIRKNVFFDYLYVDDFIRILEYFIDSESKEKSYNIGRGESVDLLNIANLINKISKNNSKIIIKKKGIDNEYTCDNSRLKREIHNLQFTRFEESIRELYSWYKSTKSSVFDGGDNYK